MTNGNMDRNVEAIIPQRRLLAAQPRDVIFTAIIGGLLVVFLSKALESHFIGNLQILAILMAPIGIVAVGQTLVVITGGVDLSVESITALTGIIIARLTTAAVNISTT